MSTALPPRIAFYERTVAGSLAGVWENVHDWEHLPWLHASSFASIALLDSGEWGWRARVGLPAGPEIEIELRKRDGEQAYDVTTHSGPGVGSVIATRLAAAGPDTTRVEVGFHIPGIGNDAAAGVGAGFVSLYTRLWDEDEAMIVARADAETHGPTPLTEAVEADLGPRGELALPVSFELGGRRFHAAEVGGQLVAWAAACPHRHGPLPDAPDSEGCVLCPWHGYRFDVRSGRSADERNLFLGRAPTLTVGDDGHLHALLEPDR